MRLVAGYKAKKSNTVGVSVLNNGVDYFVDEDSSTHAQTKYARLNTELNVYGADNSDHKIQEVSAIYVRFPNTVTVGEEQVPFTENMITSELLQKIRESIMAKDKNDSTKVSKLDRAEGANVMKVVKINKMVQGADGRIISYTYNVQWPDEAEESHAVTLTNKNRIQFVLPTTVENYEGGVNAAIIVFAAIKYGDSDETAEWKLSDNYASYIYAASGDT